MHPVIRILSFLVFTLFISRAATTELGIAALSLVCCMFAINSDSLPASWRMLKRLRWLFVSILVIYFWFTPGEALSIGGIDPAWLPSLAGIESGLQRITALVLIVLAVNLLLAVSRREELLSALLWLSRPLQYLGVSAERLALRLVLTLETVPEVQTLLEKRLADLRKGEGKGVKGIGDALASLFSEVTRRADSLPARQVVIICPAAPVIWQWSIPLAIASAFLLI